MEKDVNNTQVVTEEDVNKDQVVTDPGVTEQPADAQNQDVLADGTDPKKTVPYSRLQEETKAKKAAEEAQVVAEEQTARAQRDLELIQMTKVADPVQPKTSMDQALADCGVTAEDMYGEVIPRVMARKDEIDRANAAQQQAVLGVQQFMVNHPDINQVVGSVNPATGQIVSPSAEVMALVAKKPYLRQSTTEAIYDAVIESRELAEFKKVETANKEHLDRQVLDNDLQPLGGSAAGGGGAGDVNQPMMSREQQLEVRRKVEAGEAV